MSQRLQITLSAEATARYLSIAGARTSAEVNADCEPSGTSVTVDIGAFYSSVMVEQSPTIWVDLGEADVDLVDHTCQAKERQL